MRHQPFSILLHIALAIILVGAFVTHFFGIQGSLTLRSDAPPVSRFEKRSGPGDGELPFSVSLDEVEIMYYPATTTPMDFRSVIIIENHKIPVSMNKVGEYEGWRFYQSGIGPDSSTLSVSHDPWGTVITYTGYLLLGIGMAGFFLQKHTPWRSLLQTYRKGIATSLLLLCIVPALRAMPAASEMKAVPVTSNNKAASKSSDLQSVRTSLNVRDKSGALHAMQRPLAANFGKILVYWNGRVSPVQTMARDVTAILYGGESYKGFTPEQILSGWLFYYDEWLRDYIQEHPELKKLPPYPVSKKDREGAERLGLVEWLGTGEIFKIFPYISPDGHMEWLSLTGKRPSGMPLEQWTFMQTSMQDIKALLLKGKNIRANEELSCLMERQRFYAGDVALPSERKIEAERCYNRIIRPAIAGIPAIIFGLLTLILPFLKHKSKLLHRSKKGLAGSTSPTSITDRRSIGLNKMETGRNLLQPVSLIMSVVLTLYVALALGMLWWISGHVPLSNGPETMLFMALVSFAGACFCSDLTLRGGLVIVGAMSLFVAAMGGRTPQIGAMMPVLSSPLLSIHVMIVMISYSLFFLMAVVSAVALLSHSEERSLRLSVLNRIILTPAVCLLGAGIFIGAVWANQTWGRYWGWDPKETCALVMWLVYALPVHWGSRRLSLFRKPKMLHIYLLAAILTVLFTYFGANYFLSGLHSYA